MTRAEAMTQPVRGLIYDTQLFVDHDHFYAEYTVKFGIEAFMTLVGEMLGSPVDSVLLQTDPQAPQEQSLRYYLPSNQAVKDKAASNPVNRVPVLMLSDTVLAALLFADKGKPSLLFNTLYPIAFGHSHAHFDRAFRQMATSSSLIRHIGQQLHALFGDSRMPGEAALQAVAHDLTRRAMENLNGPPPAQTLADPGPAPHPGPSSTKDPLSLN